MRIGIDYTAAVRQGAGIGRYTRELVRALAELDRENDYVLFAAAGRQRLADRGWPPNFQMRSLPLSDRALTILWHRLRLPLWVELVTGSSRDVLTKLFERTVDIDLVFIDGDHTEDAVRADWALSSPHAPLVLFHDAAMYAVSRVVDEAEAAGWNVTRFPTTFVEGDGRLVGVALAARKGAAGF